MARTGSQEIPFPFTELLRFITELKNPVNGLRPEAHESIPRPYTPFLKKNYHLHQGHPSSLCPSGFSTKKYIYTTHGPQSCYMSSQSPS
jgi:hypothetical protein